MKKLNDYITESEQWMESPSEGDSFGIELADDTLLETYVMEVADDGSILLDSTEEIYSLLESWNMLSDEDAEQQLAESHFAVGDRVKCRTSGMKGQIVKLDKDHGADDDQYYTVKRDDGQTKKMAPKDMTKLDEAAPLVPLAAMAGGALARHAGAGALGQMAGRVAGHAVGSAIDRKLNQEPEQPVNEFDVVGEPKADSGEYDEEGDMAKNELLTIIRAARKLTGMLDNDDNMPEWTQKKITKAADYVDTAADYIASQKERGIMEQPATESKYPWLDSDKKNEDSPVARAVLHRIMMQHPGVLATHGPAKVMDAVDELAYHVGDVEEIGSSDVSGWTREVIRMLSELPDEPMDVAEGIEDVESIRDRIESLRKELKAVTGSYPGDDRNRDLIRSQIFRAKEELKAARGKKTGVNEAATRASVSKLLRHIERHHPNWFDDYGLGEVEDAVVDMAEQGQFSGMTVVDAAAIVGQELESMYGQQGVAEDSGDDGFYVYIGSESQGGFVGTVIKDGGKWREMGGEGNTPHNWGGTYMSYLSPDEVMQWIRQDYRRGYEVAGPFSDENEAYAYAERMGGLDPVDDDDEAEYQEGVSEGSADLTDIWQAGREAAYSGKSMMSCPHKMFSKEWDAWQQGWQDQKGSTSDDMNEAEYQGRKVTLNKPMSNTDGKSKSKVYVKDPKTGNVKKVTFGDPNMRIRKSNPDARRSFRARHKCDTAKDRTTARYWSCKKW
jgi:hypothetical protein